MCLFSFQHQRSCWSAPSSEAENIHSPCLPLVPSFKCCKYLFDLEKSCGSHLTVKRPPSQAKKVLHKTLQQYTFPKISRFSNPARQVPALSVMFPSAWRGLLWLLISLVPLSYCSVEFFIYQEVDLCSRDNIVSSCYNNTDRGGLCAYASDANIVWCCPAPDQYVQYLIAR